MGYSTEILVWFLKTRDANVAKAHEKWLVKSFRWNFNQIDCSLCDLLAYLKILFYQSATKKLIECIVLFPKTC
jgi:hypothetical protein